MNRFLIKCGGNKNTRLLNWIYRNHIFTTKVRDCQIMFKVTFKQVYWTLIITLMLIITWEVLWSDEVRPHLSGSQRIELLNAKLEIWMRSLLVSSVWSVLFIFLRICHPITCEESHTGPSMITFFLFAASIAIGHVPNTLQITQMIEMFLVTQTGK